MAEEGDQEEKTSEDGEKKSGKKKLLLILAPVLLLAIGVPAFLFLGGGEEPSTEGQEEAHDEIVHYETYELGEFIVNLSSSSSFLKVRLLVEYDPNLVHAGGHGEGGGAAYGGGGAGGGGAAAGPPGVLGDREPMIRDSIIRVLSSKKAEQVLTLQGKEELKEELIDAINEATGLDEGPVVNIYFLEFIVQ